MLAAPTLPHSLRDEIGTVLSGIGAWICTYHNQCHVGKYLIKALCVQRKFKAAAVV